MSRKNCSNTCMKILMGGLVLEEFGSLSSSGAAHKCITKTPVIRSMCTQVAFSTPWGAYNPSCLLGATWLASTSLSHLTRSQLTGSGGILILKYATEKCRRSANSQPILKRFSFSERQLSAEKDLFLHLYRNVPRWNKSERHVLPRSELLKRDSSLISYVNIWNQPITILIICFPLESPQDIVCKFAECLLLNWRRSSI